MSRAALAVAVESFAANKPGLGEVDDARRFASTGEAAMLVACTGAQELRVHRQGLETSPDWLCAPCAAVIALAVTKRCATRIAREHECRTLDVDDNILLDSTVQGSLSSPGRGGLGEVRYMNVDGNIN